MKSLDRVVAQSLGWLDARISFLEAKQTMVDAEKRRRPRGNRRRPIHVVWAEEQQRNPHPDNPTILRYRQARLEVENGEFRTLLRLINEYVGEVALLLDRARLANKSEMVNGLMNGPMGFSLALREDLVPHLC